MKSGHHHLLACYLISSASGQSVSLRNVKAFCVCRLQRDGEHVKQLFCQTFMETIYLVYHVDSLPAYQPDDRHSRQVCLSYHSIVIWLSVVLASCHVDSLPAYRPDDRHSRQVCLSYHSIVSWLSVELASYHVDSLPTR